MRFYYATGWPTATLHVSSDNASWRQIPLRPASKPQWLTCDIDCREKIEFVITDDNDNWDKTFEGENYTVSVQGPTLVLVDGRVAFPLDEKPVMLVVDLDGTLFGHERHLYDLKRYWRLNHVWSSSLLVYNTGRNLRDALKGAAEWKAPRADFIVSGCGTEVYKIQINGEAEKEEQFPYWCPSVESAVLVDGWRDHISFDKRQAEKLLAPYVDRGVLEIHGNDHDDPYRVPTLAMTAFLDSGGSRQIRESLSDFNVVISGGGGVKYVDILPRNANKLTATVFLAKSLNFPLSSVLVCGDSGNDVDLFCHDDVKGCCVSNAQQDLVDFLETSDKVTPHVLFASEPCAGGILQAIAHHDFR